MIQLWRVSIREGNMNLSFKLKIRKHALLFRIYRTYDIEDNVGGLTSQLPDGNHIFMADYDDLLNLEDLKKEIKEKLIDQEGFGNIEIWESSYNRYFILGFYERIPYKNTLKITYGLNCDKKWKQWRMERDNMVLRTTRKAGYKVSPTFVCVIKGKDKQLSQDQKDLRRTFYEWVANGY